MNQHNFSARHIGPQKPQVADMLKTIGVDSIDTLINQTVPAHIRLNADLDISSSMSENDYLNHIQSLASKNQIRKNYIGLGYFETFTPPVILRNILENPGWYTAYTPYQAEIAQGRLEALLNFQTMVTDLTGMPIANASLLDESTAAAEAMIMFFHSRTKEKENAGGNKFFVDAEVYPQTLSVLKGRAERLGIELVMGDYNSFSINASFFGALVQYPNNSGVVVDYKSFTENCHNNACFVAVASDLMALTLLTPPGEWGADVCLGNSQRFGVPMGFGGPHAAFFASTDDFKRNMPGRIIGVSKDRLGNMGLRMSLQTREQHIRREKATSNICTAQALLAVMASMYCVYHGPKGVQSIAKQIANKAASLAATVHSLGLTPSAALFFDTVKFNVPDASICARRADEKNLNIRIWDNQTVSVSIGENTSDQDLLDLVFVLSGKQVKLISAEASFLHLARTSKFLTHSVFNSHHSETEMLRYMKKLENKDLSLTHAMIPLGSCTMKLNATSEMIPVTWPAFANMHPYAPASQTIGYQEMINNLHDDLCQCTGFAGVSLQPNSGAQGELAGLLVIMAYHKSRGDHHRNICLIPSSAHGTNPASAVMAGFKVVVVKCDENGNVDVEDLKAKSLEYNDQLAALMITYPSTHGVFEESIKEITSIIHQHGGQVYMDGANMNAQVGLTNPGNIGADVCHLNLHKTFAIPHGGGGPGMGPIGVAKHLVPFLPGNPIVKTGGDQAIDAVSAAPFGSALILLISYGYIKMLGAKGVTDSTKFAILNANYIKAKLQDHYPVLYTGNNDRVAHEMILDCRSFKSAGIEVEDIAKRLMDYGFHAPTVSFPVAGTLMIEPTESEPLAELNRFVNAMISIRQEIEEVVSGSVDKSDNVLKMAPHTAAEVCSDNWNHTYARSKAAFPMVGMHENKFWPSVARVDNAFGDRNLICTCPSIESYETA